MPKKPEESDVYYIPTTDSRGAVIGESAGLFTTDETGHVLIYDFPPGAYRVFEVQAPAGYPATNVKRRYGANTSP